MNAGNRDVLTLVAAGENTTAKTPAFEMRHHKTTSNCTSLVEDSGFGAG